MGWDDPGVIMNRYIITYQSRVNYRWFVYMYLY